MSGYIKMALLLIIILTSVTQTANAEIAGIIAEAEAAYRAGMYEKCLELYKEAIGIELQPNRVYYDAACCAALSGRDKTALDYLAFIAANGFKDYEKIKSESNLVGIHGNPRWDEILNQIELNLKDYLSRINVELYEMVQEDQRLWNLPEDSVNRGAVEAADRKHREKAMEILASEGLRHPDDYFHAALIFQHGDLPSDYQMAHELARSGLTLDSTHAALRWLFALTKDRWLWSVGKAQIYGTQSTIRDGRWTLEPLDTMAVTDEDREALGLPSLEYYINRVKNLNNE